MSAERRAPAFDFARQLPRDLELRAYLASFGYISGMTLCALGPDDPWEKAEALTSDVDGPVLAVRQDPTAPHGWELRWVGLDPEFVATARKVMRDNAEALRRLSRHDGGHGLHNAAHLGLIGQERPIEGIGAVCPVVRPDHCDPTTYRAWHSDPHRGCILR